MSPIVVRRSVVLAEARRARGPLARVGEGVPFSSGSIKTGEALTTIAVAVVVIVVGVFALKFISRKVAEVV